MTGGNGAQGSKSEQAGGGSSTTLALAGGHGPWSNLVSHTPGQNMLYFVSFVYEPYFFLWRSLGVGFVMDGLVTCIDYARMHAKIVQSPTSQQLGK